MENKIKISVKRLLDGRVTDGPHETPEFKVTGIPFLSVDGIQDGKLIFQGCRYISQEDADNYRKKCAPRFGDILLGKAASVGKVAFVDVDFIFSVWSPLALLRPKPTALDGKYLYYCIQSELIQYQIKLFSNFNTQQNIGMRDIENLYIPDLPIVQQKSIVRFLDRKTAAIDTLIAKKQRLIQLLEEKRTALINQAVTKGLNPNAPMKDSGIPWIGEIPEHWEFVRIGYFAQVGNGSTPKRDNSDYWSSEGFPWLNSSKINDEIIYDSDQYVSKQALKECHLPIVHPESVLVAITGEGKTRGRSAMLKFQATINQHLAYIKVIDSHLNPEYLWRYLQAAYQWLRSESSGGGSTRAALTCEFLKEMKVPMPPLEEQVQITYLVAEKTQKIYYLAQKTVASIEKLQEYRRSLITAAVTGKLDISNLNQET